MNDTETVAAPPAGDNVPSFSLDETALKDTLEYRAKDVDKRAADLLAAAERCEVNDDGTAQKATVLLKQIADCNKAATKIKDDIGGPLYAAHKRVTAFFKPLTGRLDDAKKKANGKLGAYQERVRAEKEREAREAREKAEREQREAQEAARRAAETARAAENEAAQAEAIEAERRAEAAREAAEQATRATASAGTVRSDYGQTASLRTRSVVESIDFDVLLKSDVGADILRNEKVRDAIRSVVSALVRGGMAELPGVTIQQETTTVVR